MKKYLAKNRVQHDNRNYEPGSWLELDDDAAAPLLVVGVIEESAEPVEIEQLPVKTEGSDGSEAAGAASDDVNKIEAKASKKAK